MRFVHKAKETFEIASLLSAASIFFCANDSCLILVKLKILHYQFSNSFFEFHLLFRKFV